MPESLALIGISGAGKSTVASRIAAVLGYEWADSDREIERRTGRTIPDIFANDGEGAFRGLEADVAGELCARGGFVVATGGGLPVTPAGREALAPAFVVWLRIAPETAAARLAANPETEERPLLAGDTLARLETLARSRGPHYEVAADAIVAVDTLDPDEVAAAVLAAFRAHQASQPEARTAP